MSASPANRQIARAAGTVMAAIIFGQLAGLVRSIVVARAFPFVDLSAFFAANRVSETLFNLIAGGALGSAFIPSFTGFLARDDRAGGWRLASAIANLLVLVLSLLAVLAGIFAPQIVRYVLAPGFAENPALFNLTVDLLRIQLASAVLFGLGGLVVGILNAHQVFLIPALTPSMYQFGLIFGALVLAPRMGIYGLAWGVVIGAACYLLLQIPSLLARRGSYTLTLGLDDPSVREVVTLMGPRLLGVAVVQLNFWVNTALASEMSAASVAGLQFGFMLMLLAEAAIAQSVAIAAMPTFSAQYALGQIDEMRHALAAALRGVLLLAVPASLGLIVLRTPIVAMLYQRGKFDAAATALVSWALLWYAAGLVGHSMMEVLTRAFYAQRDTRTPVIIGTGAMILNVVFSFAFSALFTRIGWLPHGGLALANSLATALEAALLFAVMRRRLNGIHGDEIARGFLQTILAGTAMLLVLAAWVQVAGGSRPWLLALGGVILGGAIYGSAMLLLHVPEIRTVLGFIRRRVFKDAQQ